MASGARVGPRLLTTGEPLDGSRIYYPGGVALDGGGLIDLQLARAETLGFDFIKTYVRLPDLLQKRIIDARASRRHAGDLARDLSGGGLRRRRRRAHPRHQPPRLLAEDQRAAPLLRRRRAAAHRFGHDDHADHHDPGRLPGADGARPVVGGRPARGAAVPAVGARPRAWRCAAAPLAAADLAAREALVTPQERLVARDRRRRRPGHRRHRLADQSLRRGAAVGARTLRARRRSRRPRPSARPPPCRPRPWASAPIWAPSSRASWPTS